MCIQRVGVGIAPQHAPAFSIAHSILVFVMEAQVGKTAVDRGVNLADAERTVASNMTQIVEKLRRASSTACMQPAASNLDHVHSTCDDIRCVHTSMT